MTFDLYFVGVMSSLQCNICRAYIYTLLVSCRHYNVMLAQRILKAEQVMVLDLYIYRCY